MSGTMDNIRAKFKRTFSHKDKEVDFDNVDEPDEETTGIISKEVETHEKDEAHPIGRPGTLLNRMISYGNKKTEDELARDKAEYEARLAKGGTYTGAPDPAQGAGNITVPSNATSGATAGGATTTPATRTA